MTTVYSVVAQFVIPNAARNLAGFLVSSLVCTRDRPRNDKLSHYRLFSIVLLFTGLMCLTPTPVKAVTDEELKALEQQIEQQEADQKEKANKRVQEKIKRKAEDESKQQIEEEAKTQAEAEKKAKYLALIAEAEQAIKNNDKNLALRKYTEALALYPDDPVAYSGIQEAIKQVNNFCTKIIGTWESIGVTLTFNPEGTWSGTALIVPIAGAWKCMNPNVPTFYIQGKILKSWMAILREDGCLTNAIGGCFRKAGDKKESVQENTPSKNPLLSQ